MKIKINTLFFFIFALMHYFGKIEPAEHARFDTPVVIAVPAICGNNTYKGYSENILALMVETHAIHKTGTLPFAERPDLGQERCVNHLKSKIEPHIQKPVIFVATSQGSGTVTNYIAQTPAIHETIKGLMCEGYVASFNQSIVHTIQSRLPFTEHLPLKDYWLPYIARCCPYLKGAWFPFYYYNPAETQPFERLKDLPHTTPIILVHCKQDLVTPHDGAEIAYYNLKSTGHKEVYLISVDADPHLFKKFDDGHINVVAKDTQEHIFLQKILNKILYDNQETLTDYQPDKMLFKQKAEQLENREDWIKKVGTLLTTLKYCAVLYVIAHFIKLDLKKNKYPVALVLNLLKDWSALSFNKFRTSAENIIREI